ncbi:MAG: hypothetical protein HPY59_16860 [Anaerolineae bacterium]|nr:hypothetical protein [Anaerolineae bacterium]
MRTRFWTKKRIPSLALLAAMLLAALATVACTPGAPAKAQEWIDAAKAEGKEVARPEAALLSFQTALVEAQISHEAAGSILAVHIGIDESGNVIDG